jgi:hypothetical protein
MKSFKLFSIGCKMVFLPHISAFSYSVAQLCSAKKVKSETKISIFRFNQKSLNHFNIKKFYTLQIIHKLFTSKSAKNGSRGEILNIPYSGIG